MIRNYPEIEIVIRHDLRAEYSFSSDKYLCMLTKQDAACLFQHNLAYMDTLWGDSRLDYKSVLELFTAIDRNDEDDEYWRIRYHLCLGLMRALKAIEEGKKVMLEVGV
jgi:hypothetical protein